MRNIPQSELVQSRRHPIDGGELRFMARSGGYCMVRRPRCIPFVMPEKKWYNLQRFETAASEKGKSRA